MKLFSFFSDIQNSIDDNSSMSVSSITLLLSAFIGFMLGLCMCFVLIYDVVTNGYVKTDLIDLGIFLLASGGYIAGSGIPKTVIDSRFEHKYGMRRHASNKNDNEEEEEDDDNPLPDLN